MTTAGARHVAAKAASLELAVADDGLIYVMMCIEGWRLAKVSSQCFNP